MRRRGEGNRWRRLNLETRSRRQQKEQQEGKLHPERRFGPKKFMKEAGIFIVSLSHHPTKYRG
jgi:hypothetical protein